jgi:hypothetical protein
MATVALYIVAYAVALSVQTGILAMTLFLVEDVKAGSFKEFGAAGTLGRCAAIVIATTVLALIPFGILLALLVWFLGIMFLFQKTFVQTLILFVLNGIVSIAIGAGLEHVLASLLR